MKYLLLILFLLSLLGSFFYLTAPAEVVLVVLVFCLFALPGIVLGRHYWGATPEGYFFGTAWGVLISAFLSAVTSWLFGWNQVIQLGAILILTLVVVFFAHRKEVAVCASQGWYSNEWSALFIFLILATFFLLIPYRSLGVSTSLGLAFPSLFGHDFIIRSSIAASLSQSLPPNFLPFSGQVLDNYYWLSYMLPATVYKILGPSYSMHHILTLTVFLYSLLFLAVLYSLLRIFLPEFKTRVWCLALALAAYNYYWIYVLLKNGHDSLPGAIPSLLENYDLLGHSDISHAWLRDLIFEPQAVLALAVLFTIIGMVHLNRQTLRYDSLLTGLLLILIFATDSFIGLIGVIWYFSYAATRLLVKGERLAAVRNIIITLIPLALMYILYLKMQMYSLDKSSSSVILKPYWVILAFFPVYLLLEYGLLAIMGIPGLLTKAKQHFHLVLLSLWCLFFILFVQLSIENDVVIRKSQKILQFPLLIFTGLALGSLLTQNRKRMSAAILSILALLAVPTLFTDLRAASNISDVKNVTYLAPEDFQACQWLKRNTPVGSIVLSSPQYQGGKYEFSLIALFAERQMVIGEWKVSRMQVVNDTSLLWERYRDVQTIFESANADSSSALIRSHKVDYIYVGPREQKLYGQGCAKFAQLPELFEPIYSQGGVNIYRVLL